MSGTTIQAVRLKQIHQEGAVTVREDVHKKAFTKWLNSHLSKADPPIRVVDLIRDLSDGKVWLSLFDVLLNTKTGRESGSSHVHNIYNLQKALEICQKNEIKIEGINASDIAEGNSKSILGLLWNIIVHFQMKGTLKAGSKEYSIEKNLQTWCLTQLDRYKEFVQVKDFSTSWRDGKAFNAVLHSYNPDLFDFSHILTMDNFSRLEHAFTLASLEWNVPRLLEPVDVDIEKPDKKMITMYLTCLYERLESADKSRDSGMRQSQREVSSTSSVSRQVVTKKSIRLSSVSSDISTSSSIAEPLSPTSTTLETPQEIVETVTTVVDAPENDLPRRVKHSEMYMLSPRSSDGDGSPLMSRRFVGDTDSDSTSTSTDTVIHVETASGNKTTTTTTTTTRRIQLRGGLQGEEETEGETTTTTVIRETYMMEMPGETRERSTYGTGIEQSQDIEDKLSSECESILETTDGLEKSFTVKEDQSKILEDKLTEAAIALSDLESRVKTRESGQDVKELIKERDQLQFQVNQVLLTGRKMALDRILDGEKEAAMIEKLDKLERRLKLLMLWPIRDIRSVTNYDKLLDDKLKVVEAAVVHLEPKVKKSVVTRDIKALAKEREDLELKATVVADLGRDLIRDKQIDQDKEKDIIKRMEQLEMKIQLIMMWPIKKLNKLAFSSTSNYSTYLKQKFDEAESSVANIELRIKKSYRNDDNTDLIRERSKMYLMVRGAVGLGHSMIEHRLLNYKEKKDFSQRIETLEDITNVLMAWPIRENKRISHDRFLQNNLEEAESAIEEIEPRIDNADVYRNNTVLIEERHNLQVKTQAVVITGRGMSEDNLLDRKTEASFLNRLDRLEKRMNAIMDRSLDENNGNVNHDIYLDKKIQETDVAVNNMEQRLRESVISTDNTALVKERAELQVKVYGIVALGRGMIEDKKINKEKENDLSVRLERLETRAKGMMRWPVQGLSSSEDRYRFLDGMLSDVETAVSNLEPRIRQKNINANEIKNLNADRENLETKVYGVVSLGRAMIEDKLIDKKNEKNYQQRIDDVDGKMKMLMSWPIRKLSSNEDYDKYFEDKLKKVETSVGNMEPRIRKSSSNKDNKELLKEREDLDVQVYGTVSLGRAMMEDMLFSSKKEREFRHRIDQLERNMKMLMMWPINGRTQSSLLGRSDHDHDQFLDEKLNEVTTEVTNFEPRLRNNNLSADEIENLHSERDVLDTKVYGFVSLGQAMIEDKLIDKKNEKYYQQRIDDVDGKMKMLMSWPIRRLSGKEDYDKYFEDKLNKVETSVGNMEPRIRKSSSNKDNKELLKEREDLDVQVYGTVSLGRAMMEDMLFSSKKEREFQHRIDNLEQKMRKLMMWPIKATGSGLALPDHDEFLDKKLNEVTSELTTFEPRLRKKTLSTTELKNLHSDRDDLETKVYGVVSLGRAMIEDKLIDKKNEKYYQQRIDDVDRKMKMLMSWPIRRLSSNEDYDKYFEDKLNKVETSVGNMEPRIRKSSSNKDNKVLMDELKDLDVQVYGTVSLGRAMMEDMLFSSRKEGEFKHRIDELEIKMKMMWQIGSVTRKPMSGRHKSFDANLRQMEITVSEFDERAKVKDRESVDLKSAKEGLDEIKLLVFEGDQIELDALGLLNEGRTMMEEEDIDQLDKDYYERRMNRLEKRVHVLREWLANEMQRLFNIYIILIQQHLERLHDWLMRAEAKIDLEDDIAPTREDVTKQYDDHLEFHKEVGAYSTINMILDIDMDDPAVDDGLRQDIKNTSERWAAVWNWSEERKKHLADVIDDWEKFRDEEERLFDWLCNKEDEINMTESTDISNGEEVVSHRSLLQSIILEMGEQEIRLHVFLEAGELLITNAQYHNSTAKPIRDEMNDFDECWKTTLDRAQRHKSQLEDSRDTFLKLAELKNDIKKWLKDTEKLLSSADEERDENEQDNYLDKIRVKCEERDLKQKDMDQINSLIEQLRPSIEDNSAQNINLVVKPLNRRWQDTSDRLDQCRENERPLLHNDCWLVAHIKKALAAKKKGQEVHFK